MSDDLKPWDRQPRESSKAYNAFQIYLDLGEQRTIRAVAEQLGLTQQHLRMWSTKNRWVERTAAWDSMPRNAMAKAYEEVAREIADQHLRLANKLMDRLDRNLDLLDDGEDPTMRWSTAAGVAHKSHSLALDITKPEDNAKAEIIKAIENVIQKLAGEE